MSGSGTAYLDRPRVLATSGVMAVALAAWLALAVLGRDVTDWAALCRAVVLEPEPAWPGLVGMWFLMSVAMMLPTAAPAIDIYVRLTRRIEARRRAHVAAFAGGFVAAWAGLAVLAGGAQAHLSAPLGARAAALPGDWPAGAVMLLAGLYQLTPLKQACLTLCRTPLTFFMSHWRDGPGGALRMGVHHGVVCIGCCWALMGLMLVAGAMNLAWMAGLGLVMLVEKTAPGAVQLGRLAGLALVLAGGALIVNGFL